MTRLATRSQPPSAISSLLTRLAVAAAAFVLVLVLPATPLPRLGKPHHDRLVLHFERLGSASAEWISPALSTSKRFRMIGASWPATSTTEGAAFLRTSGDGKDWSAWTELEMTDIGPDPGSAERSRADTTEPLWVGEARFAQVKWDGTPPANARLHLLNPGPDPATASDAADAAPGMPGIVSRSGWGADENLRKCCPSYAQTVKFAVVHHTATSNSYSAADSPAIVRSTYQYHVGVNGWDDVGYNFMIDKYGKVFEGRAGGIRDAVIGAHAQGFNTGSTGASLIGTFQSSDPPGAAMDSLRNLLAWKLDLHHVNPKGSLTVVSGGSQKYPAGQSVNIPTIVGHRDTQSTQCPGDRVMSRLGSLRSAVHDRGLPKIFNPIASPPVFTPNGDGSGDQQRLRATTAGANSWRIRVRNASGNQLRSWTGSGQPDVNWNGLDSAGQAAPHGYYKVEFEASQGSSGATPAKVDAGLFRSPWGAWTPAGTILDQREAPGVGARKGQFHMVSRAPNGAVYQNQWSGSEWGAARRLGGGGDFAAGEGRLGFVADANGTLHAVIRGTNSNLYHGRIETNGSFGGWRRIGTSSNRGRDLGIAADSAGTIHVMVEGTDGGLYWNRYKGGWSTWKRVGGSGAHGTQPVLAGGAGGDVMSIVVGEGNVLYANKLDPGKSWRSSWTTAGGSKWSGIRPAITAVKEGFLVAVRGNSSTNIYQSAGTIGNWSGWRRIGSGTEGGSEPALITAGEDVMLVIRGRTSPVLYFNVRSPTGSWRGFSQAGGSSQEGGFPTLAKVGTTVMLAAETGGPPPSVIARPPLRGN